MNAVYFALGAALARLFPAAAAEEQRQFTIPGLDGGARSPLRRLIRYYLGRRMQRSPGDLEATHKDFWRHQRRDDWYRHSQGRHDELHVPMLAPVIERLRPLVEARRIRQVCEFGAGSGHWLDYLSRQWPSVGRYVGVDLSADQIAENAKRWPRLEFACADLADWAAEQAAPSSIFVTNCGVLEYLSQPSLERLLAVIARKAPSSLVLFVEPVDAGMDLERELDSQPHGSEHSFSHNHAHLLRQAGFRLLFQEERLRDGYRFVATVAETPGAG